MTLVLGVFLGSALWFLTLSSGVATVRHMISDSVFRLINRGAAVLLAAFGVYALASGVSAFAGSAAAWGEQEYEKGAAPMMGAPFFKELPNLISRTDQASAFSPSTTAAVAWTTAAMRIAACTAFLGDAVLHDFLLVALDAHAAAVDGRDGERPQLEIDLVDARLGHDVHAQLAPASGVVAGRRPGG